MRTLTKVYEKKKVAKAISLRFPAEDRRDILFTILARLDIKDQECSELYAVPIDVIRGSIERGRRLLSSAIRAGRLKPEDLRGLS